MFRSARRPCKACDGISPPSSADSLGETDCILGNLIKELLKVSLGAARLNDLLSEVKIREALKLIEAIEFESYLE